MNHVDSRESSSEKRRAERRRPSQSTSSDAQGRSGSDSNPLSPRRRRRRRGTRRHTVSGIMTDLPPATNPPYLLCMIGRLLFLDNTLDGIIKRFEDEFPDTRMPSDRVTPPTPPTSQVEQALSISPGANDAEPDATGTLSDAEDGTGIRPSGLARSNSVMSISSKGLTNEEGRVLRAGHKFRSGWLKLSNLLSGEEENGAA